MKITTRFTLLNVVMVMIAISTTTGFALYRINAHIARQATADQGYRLKTFWELLKAKGNDFRVVDGKLLVGSYQLNGNYEIPDKIKEIFGGTATIFMGDTRVSTNIHTRTAAGLSAPSSAVPPMTQSSRRANRSWGRQRSWGFPTLPPTIRSKTIRGRLSARSSWERTSVSISRSSIA